MNHHRVGLSALVALFILSMWYAYDRLAIHKGVAPVPIPFIATVLPEIVHGDTSKKQIIFTFDGGDGNQSASIILDILKKHNVKGTFFLTGKWILRNADLSRRMITEGHEIFNHTYDHPYLTELDKAGISSELVRMEDTSKSIIDVSTKPYFRPPYGDRDPSVLAAAADSGFRSVYWTIDAHDWMESDGVTAGEVQERILSNLQPGAIILMHLGDTITGAILDDVFTSIEQQGYKVVSLTQGL